MSKIPMSSMATLSFKLLLGLTLLVCVAAAPFGTVDRVEHESAKTLAFAGQLLEVGKERWAVEGHAQLAVSAITKAPGTVFAPQEVNPEPVEPTMGGSTTCPVSHTSCPQQMTLCPTHSTNCPQQETVCVTTQCPATATICPEVATTCQLTTCPAIPTSCPTLATVCPDIWTLCPSRPTLCPQSQTTCPKAFTVCYVVATQCPTDPTVCQFTVCPFEATHCPEMTTVCEFTKCNTDRESSCPDMNICMICGISYQQGPPAGFLEPVVLAEAAVARVHTSAVLAPRLAFLP